MHGLATRSGGGRWGWGGRLGQPQGLQPLSVPIRVCRLTTPTAARVGGIHRTVRGASKTRAKLREGGIAIQPILTVAVSGQLRPGADTAAARLVLLLLLLVLTLR